MAENEGPMSHTGYIAHALRVNGRCICERCIEYRIDVQRGRDPRALARDPGPAHRVRCAEGRPTDPADLEHQLTALGAMRAAMRRVFP